MDLSEVMAELAASGTEQNRKVYARHGASANQFGVSYADLGKLQKRLKKDHQLALQLWETGNCDGRILATMIADPAAADDALLERWVGDLDYYILTDAFARHLVFRTPHAGSKMREWITSPEEWRARAGWVVVALQVLAPQVLTDAEAQELLDFGEKQIQTAPNRVKDAINNVIIAIGMRGGACETAALAAAARIGKVEVDHGATGCKTPNAAAYIAKAKTRSKKR